MNDINNIINSFNIEHNRRQWILRRSTVFKHQFVFYFKDLQFSLTDAVNRASEETDEIYQIMELKILETLVNANITDAEKLVYIANALN